MQLPQRMHAAIQTRPGLLSRTIGVSMTTPSSLSLTPAWCVPCLLNSMSIMYGGTWQCSISGNTAQQCLAAASPMRRHIISCQQIKTVVLSVLQPHMQGGQILNFNVGSNLDLRIPRVSHHRHRDMHLSTHLSWHYHPVYLRPFVPMLTAELLGEAWREVRHQVLLAGQRGGQCHCECCQCN